jgi:hypothetical protein
VPVLPPPPPGDAAVDWVAEHLGDLCGEPPRASSLVGGQAAADAALAALDLTGYASRRSTVLPVERRGATRLSPYVRHGLLTLPQLWAAAKDAPYKDRQKYRDELLWQEYARHVYARLGPVPRRTTAPSSRGRRAGPTRGRGRWPAWRSSATSWRRRLAGEPDADVGGQPVERPSRSRLARGGGRPLPAAARRLPRRQPARLAVDGRHRVGQGVRLLALAGGEARAAAVWPVPAAGPLPDPGVA